MEKIASFAVDHLRLKRGVYVSRADVFGPRGAGATITTFDLRMKEPNAEPVIDVPALHTLEHLGATFLRSHPAWKDRIVYFGPMGCRTGLYLLVEGSETSRSILPLVRELMDWITEFEGPVPGASAAECGNGSDHNLAMARWEARKYRDEVLLRAGPENLEYPA